MKNKSKPIQENHKLLRASIYGTVLSLAVCFILTALTALLVTNETVKENSVAWIVRFIWLISVIIGTITAKTKCTENKLIAVSVTALCFGIIISSMTLLLFNGIFQTIGQGILMILAGMIPAIIMILKKPTREKIKFKI